MKIKDSVIIVTGASSGIGRETARVLGKRGAKVVLAARSAAKLKELEREISGSLAVPTDMRKPGDIAALVDATMKRYGRIDALVNNAGQGMRAPVEKIDMKEYRAVMELNVFSVVEAMQAVIPIMRARGKGVIVNISSRVSKNYFPNIAAYASTKYALNAISLTARAELAADRIAVCVFHPKVTATDFGQNSRGEKYSSRSMRPGVDIDQPEDVASKIAEQIESEEAEVSM